MRVFPILCLGILLLIAGCTAGPFGGPSAQEEPASIVVNNSADVTQTFEVWVVELPANVTYRRSDGLTGSWDIGEGVGSVEPGDNRTYTWVTLPESARLHGRSVLDPGEENWSSIEEFSRDFAVVMVVYQSENEIIEWASANCADQNLLYLKVRSRHIKANADVVVSFNCE
jgi:hypothetical protein